MKKTLLIALIISLFSISSSGQSLSLVADVNPGFNDSSPRYLTEFNSKIYFVAGNGLNHKLYSSDGTTAGTELIGPTIGNGVVWYLTTFNNKLYFTYDDGIHGLELWTSDGTAAGTQLLKDIWTGTTGGGVAYSSLPRYFTVCNGLLFFQASTPTRSEGLWVTDGTEAGTQMLGNQYSNPFSSAATFLVFNGKIYFQGNAGSGYGMWSSDGTTSGTQVVKSGLIGTSGGSHAVVNNRFYFQSGDNTIGNELWASDGTDSGTVLVKNINTVGFSSDPQNFFTDGQKVYFEATDGNLGRELWVTDGTNLGTYLVKDIAVGAASSHPGSGSPKGIIKFNNQVYFFGNSGSGVEMYKTDGTAIGTVLVQSFPSLFSVTYSHEFNGKFYFTGSVSQNGAETLFESDGTTAGTLQINPQISVFTTTTNGFNMLNFTNEIYFPAYFGSQGNELCKLTPSLVNEEWLTSEVVKVYPNPTYETITINVVDEWVDGQLSLLNLQGQSLGQWMLNSVNEIIDVTDFPSGIYLLSVQKGNRLYTQKIIKK